MARTAGKGRPKPTPGFAARLPAVVDAAGFCCDSSNRLCLAKTQDAAFDRHLITLDEDLRVVLSKSIRDHFTPEPVRANFQPYEGKRINPPHRFLPDPAQQQQQQQQRDLFGGLAPDSIVRIPDETP